MLTRVIGLWPVTLSTSTNYTHTHTHTQRDISTVLSIAFVKCNGRVTRLIGNCHLDFKLYNWFLVIDVIRGGTHKGLKPYGGKKFKFFQLF